MDPQEREKLLDQIALKQQAANDSQRFRDKLKGAFWRWLALLASG
jgi:hypothetical protein